MSARPFPSERLLAYVWETQAFAAVPLRAIDGQAVEILWRGRKNLDAGPDFLDALIRIGGRLRDDHERLRARGEGRARRPGRLLLRREGETGAGGRGDRGVRAWRGRG